MKKGIKRFVIVLWLGISPLVLADPISTLQNVALPPAPVISVTPREEISRLEPIRHEVIIGIASWYSEKDPFIHTHTANGEVFDDSERTCASWSFPFGTYIRVTNLINSESVVCRVNDRGPSKRLKRLVDLTLATFKQIANPKVGLIKVSVERVSL